MSDEKVEKVTETKTPPQTEVKADKATITTKPEKVETTTETTTKE